MLNNHLKTCIYTLRFVCIENREINITFHALHCLFFMLSLFAQPRGPGADRVRERERGGEVYSLRFTFLKGITLKYGSGKVRKTMQRVKNSYWPIENSLNKTLVCRLLLSPTVFFRVHTTQSKSPSPVKWRAQHPIVRTIVSAFASHYAYYEGASIVNKHRCQNLRGRKRNNLFNFTGYRLLYLSLES